MRVAILILAAALFVLSASPLLAQRDDPATATIRGENIWLRVDPAEDTEVVTYLQRGDAIRVTGDAVPADGDAFYPIEVVETGETGWVRDLAVDPQSLAGIERLPEVVVDEPPPANDENQPDDLTGDRDAQEAEYIAAIVEQSNELSASFTAMTELTGNPQFGDEEWAAQVADIVADWQIAREDAQVMTPPPAYTEIHATYLRALDYYNTAGENLLLGIEAVDPAFIEEATRNMELGVAELGDATDLVNELNEQRATE